jgi:hypothetical protein
MRLLLVALMLAGCGFEGEASFGGTRFPAVAPWQDVGPLTVCDGPRRLGPVRAGPLGMCERGAEVRSCAGNGDCGSREQCVCGRCVIAACDSTDECGDGRICDFGEQRCDRECMADADCLSGERCQPGRNRCRGVCESDDQCQLGETCQRGSGLCGVTSCVDDSDCSGGRACRLQRIPAALAEPSPIADGRRVTLYFERADGPMFDMPRIFRAVSDDGRRFTVEPRAPLLDGRAPSVERDGRGGWVMVYEDARSGTLIAASSPDGIAWQSTALGGLTGMAPSLGRRRDGSFVLYYAVPDGATGGRGISRASGTDPFSFRSGETVLEPARLSDPVLWRNVDRIASPFVQVLDDFERLWFAAHGEESAASIQFDKVIPTPANFSIGEAASVGNGFVPYPFNPVFDRVLEFLTHPSEVDPAVITYGDTWLLYYRRAAADGTKSDNLALARSPVDPK